MNRIFLFTSLVILTLSFISCHEEPIVPDPTPDPLTPVDTIIIDTLCSGTLPVVYINTENSCAIDSKEDYVNAEWWLDNLGDMRFVSIGSKNRPLGMQIKGHGNSTWTNLDKKTLPT